MSEALRECVSALIRIRRSIKIKVHIEGKGKCRGIIFGIPVLFDGRPFTNGDRDFPRWSYQTFMEYLHKRTTLKNSFNKCSI